MLLIEIRETRIGPSDWLKHVILNFRLLPLKLSNLLELISLVSNTIFEIKVAPAQFQQPQVNYHQILRLD